MGLFGNASSSNVVVRNDRHRRKLRRTIADRLVDIETAPHQTHEIQPLIQIVAPPSYPAWRTAWNKAWTKKGTPYSTAHWPSSLQDPDLAALLVPVMAGRIGPAIGKHPKPIAEPAFIVGALPAGAPPEDMALAALTHWIQHLAPPSASLAPPVIETLVRERVSDRRIMDLGIAWSLPAPDGA